MAAPLQSKQRVRSEGAAGTGTNGVKGGRWRALRRSEVADLSSYVFYFFDKRGKVSYNGGHWSFPFLL